MVITSAFQEFVGQFFNSQHPASARIANWSSTVLDKPISISPTREVHDDFSGHRKLSNP
jgi:hypothetical protein